MNTTKSKNTESTRCDSWFWIVWTLVFIVIWVWGLITYGPVARAAPFNPHVSTYQEIAGFCALFCILPIAVGLSVMQECCKD